MTDPGALRIGIVGGGRATRALHLPALQAVRGARVAAVADIDPEALRRVAAQFAVPSCVADYRRLLDDEAIDAIAICVPVSSHVDIAMAALDAGKHVFIEKPLALTLEDCDRLILRAEGTSLTVMLGFNTRWHRLVRDARVLMQEGALGPLDVVRSVLTSGHTEVPAWRERRASGGGVLLEMAMHHFDLWRFLLGEDVEEISAHSRSGTWEDESVTVTARLSSGALASGTFAERTSQHNSIDIYGRRGSMSLSLYRFDGLERASLSDIPGNIPARMRALGRFVQALPGAIQTSRRGGEWHLSYVEEWRHFVASVRTGQPADCGLDDGRRALAIALAAMESTATGRAVSVRGA